MFLVNSILPFIIAGKNPGASLIKEIDKNDNVQLFENPSEGMMDELIKNAHVHLLPSFNTTGIKIKLLIALFKSEDSLSRIRLNAGYS